MLLFSVAASSLLFGLAGMRAILGRSAGEALGWFFLLFTLPASRGIFEFLRLINSTQISQFATAFALAVLLTGLLMGFATGTSRFVTLSVPAIAALALSQLPGLRATPVSFAGSISALARWADDSTWGSSVFLFPDAERAPFPSVFRAQSRHALWADWKSAQGVLYSETAADVWRGRWQDTMENGFSAAKLEALLPLPIDYYVLRKQNQLAGVQAAFADSDFLAYDAEDLRNAPKPLKCSH
jgi:hypothetical protein